MPRSCSHLLSTIITTQNLFWILQFTGRTTTSEIGPIDMTIHKESTPEQKEKLEQLFSELRILQIKEQLISKVNETSSSIKYEDLNEEQADWVLKKLRRSEHITDFLKNQEIDKTELSWYEDENGELVSEEHQKIHNLISQFSLSGRKSKR